MPKRLDEKTINQRAQVYPSILAVGCRRMGNSWYPVKALSPIFGAKFMTMIRKELPYLVGSYPSFSPALATERYPPQRYDSMACSVQPIATG